MTAVAGKWMELEIIRLQKRSHQERQIPNATYAEPRHKMICVWLFVIVFVCELVYVCACVYVRVCVFVCVCMYTCVCTRVCICLCVYIHVCVHLSECLCFSVCLSICVWLCEYAGSGTRNRINRGKILKWEMGRWGEGIHVIQMEERLSGDRKRNSKREGGHDEVIKRTGLQQSIMTNVRKCQNEAR